MNIDDLIKKKYYFILRIDSDSGNSFSWVSDKRSTWGTHEESSKPHFFETHSEVMKIISISDYYKNHCLIFEHNFFSGCKLIFAGENDKVQNIKETLKSIQQYDELESLLKKTKTTKKNKI